MTKVKSLDQLRQMRATLRNELDLRERSNNPEQMVQIKVSMATCGIAAGAKEVMSCLIATLKLADIDAIVTQTGCMGFCYAEPTIEVKKPNEDPIVYGHVTVERAKEIVEKYIQGGELCPDIIPVNYNTARSE